jgi:hypothetical protein
MKTRSLLLRMLLIATLLLTSLISTLAQVGEQTTTYTIILREMDNSKRAFLAEQGISVDGLTRERIVITVTQAQLISLSEEGIQFEVLKSSDRDRLPSVAQSGYLSNEYLTISVIDTGQFTMRTADGRYLLYPGASTGYLSVKVDSQVYNNANGSLSVITPFTVVDDNSAYIQYQTPESILVTQWFTLSGQAVRFKVEVSNQDATQHDISVRYLLDTQVDINDGSPLYVPTVGVRTYETDMPILTFNSWRAYDIWPGPSLTSVGTFSTRPVRVVFAWWPNAFDYVWDYTPDPNQRFYTPGYTTSPESDSCVLVYFSMGTLSPGTQDSITMYYGTGEPTVDIDRERLLSALENFKEAVKSSIIADLDAFSALQAKYMVSLRNDWKDYLEAAWTVAGVVTPDPGDLAKLGKDAQLLSAFADAIDWMDTGNTVALALGEILGNVPASASETQVKNQIYSHFMNSVTLRPKTGGTYLGIAGYLEAIDAEYQSYIAQIPDPLPPGYPVDSVITFLQYQTAALHASSSGETYVPVYYSNMCGLAKLGVLQFQEETMSSLADRLEFAENVSFATTLTEIAALLGGAGLKVAGVVGVPLTVGGSTIVLIPSEMALWSGVASISTISSLIGAASDVGGLSIQGAMTKVSYEAIMQLPNDVDQRWAIFQHTGDWVTTATASGAEHLTQALTQSFIQIESITVPDLVISADETSGRGTGQVLIKNTGSTTATVSVYGSITTKLDQGMPIVGLVGSSSVSIAPGEEASIEFAYTLLRSSLLHYSGYDVHLFVVAAWLGGGINIQGPFVEHFFAGTDSQLSTLNGQSFETITRGTLGVGQVITSSVQFVPATQSGRLLLSFAEGSDYDLHLYDSSGNHVGVNYSTGEVENQIAGVSYSGPIAWPEWMIVENPSGDAYQVKVVVQNPAAGEGYDLSKLETPLLPAILDAPSQAVWSIVRTAKTSPTTESFGLQIAEGGGGQGVSNLQISSTNFTGDGGTIIPAGQILCEVPNEVSAGTSILGICTVTITPEAPMGTYTGAIQVSGKGAGGTTLNATTQVTLILTEPRWNIYLPLMLR